LGTFKQIGDSTIGMGLSDETTWTFLNSWALALLTAYQATCFALTFYRLIKALVDQRRIEASGEKNDRAYLFNGLGWIAAGIKFGAIESVAGFAGGSFVATLFRRICRLLGRTCLVVGLAKG
jgi:hypothetical protein